MIQVSHIGVVEHEINFLSFVWIQGEGRGTYGFTQFTLKIQSNIIFEMDPFADFLKANSFVQSKCSD